MNVMLISQCSKRALKETRRILDQFAERHGDRSWQTAITSEGLKTLHHLLRKTARKNTAVACFWIRGHNHSELMWIVGDVQQFNERGATPTNTTTQDVLRHQAENDWHTGEVIRLLGAIAGLMHDLGKANEAFQSKLTSDKPMADVYRHEWVSLRLFQLLVGNAKDDREWVELLRSLDEKTARSLLKNVIRDGQGKQQPPMIAMPPLAQAIGWLIVSHHRLPMVQDKDEAIADDTFSEFPATLGLYFPVEREQRQNEKDKVYQKLKSQCWQFPKGSAFDSRHWREHAHGLAEKLVSLNQLYEQDWLDNPYVVHLARLGLMLADHYYSSESSQSRFGDSSFPLHANTDGDGQLKQRLDEHLIGVEVHASRLLRQLPRLDRQVSRIARHKGFTRRSKDRRFAWQDKAYDLAVGIRKRTTTQGFFGVNMASTGTGKTLANGRILYGLADPGRGARFNIALGLRTLTLQTGDAYRERLGLGDEDMAVLVGGGAVRDLHDQQIATRSARGSESAEPLLDEADFVHYEGSLEDGPLTRWLKKAPEAQKLLAAPILISTIDHLMPATESSRGGHQIAPMLRLLNSDLVLDEPDDFTLDDLPALSRLVNWVGMLGSRILLSSATLPPALLHGLYEAYRSGREVYQKNRGEPGRGVNICCAWFDEFGSVTEDCFDAFHFDHAHRQFVEKRLNRLAIAKQKRKATIQTVGIAAGTPKEQVYEIWARILLDTAESLHENHYSTDPATGKRLSCGLIRMAHIDDIIATAYKMLSLGANQGKRIHLCVYHSRHPLLMRAEIEEKLDRLLKRHDPEALFKESEIRALLDRQEERDHLFVVLASPVAEVGRDHDYDWAIVEPSSFRSIIQLAGRVRRHRDAPSLDLPNIALLQTNLRHLFTGGKSPAFSQPGFETTLSGSKEPILTSHDLHDLITEAQLERIDASARIQERTPLHPRHNLADLEHAQLRALMGLQRDSAIPSRLDVTHWYRTRAHLSGELQCRQPFRSDPIRRQRYYLELDDNDALILRRFEKRGQDTEHSGRLSLVSVASGERIDLFAAQDYTANLMKLAERMDMDTHACARKFGAVDLAESQDQQRQWLYHPALGFATSEAFLPVRQTI